MTQPPPYQPYVNQPPVEGLVCPKCRGQMRTYDRNGVHLEQCDTCRGIFLDFGELEHLTSMESRLAPPPAAGFGPAWGQHGGHRYRRGGLSALFFSS